MQCGKCMQAIGAGSFIEALGKFFHETCFACGQCQQPIGASSYASDAGVPYHAECLARARGNVCAHCSRPLTTSIMEALGKKWHPECFVCGGCNQPIKTAQFGVIGGKPFHPTCQSSPQPNQMNPNGPGTGIPGGDPCAGCGQPIGLNILTALDRKWHPDCFVCQGCRQPIKQPQFSVQGDKPYHPQCSHAGEQCAQCSQPITGTVMSALGRKWHPECFLCGRCRQPIKSTQFAVNSVNLPLHPDCAQAELQSPSNAAAQGAPQLGGPACCSCSQPLGTNILNALGKKWHPDCFKCGGCQRPINQMSFAVQGDVPYHPECDAKAEKCCQCGVPLHGNIMTALGRKWHPDCFKCSVCQQVITTMQFAVDGDRPVHPQCAVPKEMCSQCSKPLSGSIMTALGRKWHPDCFSCGKCRQPIRTMQFAVDGDMPYHPECGQTLSKEVCSQCSKPLTGSIMTALGRKWHPDCFCCGKCHQPIRNMQFAVDGNVPYHPECGQSLGPRPCSASGAPYTPQAPTSNIPSGLATGLPPSTSLGPSGASKYTSSSYSSTGVPPATSLPTGGTQYTSSNYSSTGPGSSGVRPDATSGHTTTTTTTYSSGGVPSAGPRPGSLSGTSGTPGYSSTSFKSSLGAPTIPAPSSGAGVGTGGNSSYTSTFTSSTGAMPSAGTRPGSASGFNNMASGGAPTTTITTGGGAGTGAGATPGYTSSYTSSVRTTGATTPAGGSGVSGYTPGSYMSSGTKPGAALGSGSSYSSTTTTVTPTYSAASTIPATGQPTGASSSISGSTIAAGSSYTPGSYTGAYTPGQWRSTGTGN